MTVLLVIYAGINVLGISFSKRAFLLEPKLTIFDQNLPRAVVFPLPPLIAALHYGKQVYVLPRQSVIPVMMRGVFTLAGQLFYFLAIKNLPMSTAIVIFNTMPFVTRCMGHLFLRERISWSDFIAMVVSYSGVAIIALNTSQDEEGAETSLPLGFLAILFTLVLFSVAYVANRLANRRVHYLIAPFYIGVTFFVFHSVTLVAELFGSHMYSFERYNLEIVLCLFANALLSFIGTSMLSYTLSLEKAGLVAAIVSLEIGKHLQI